LDDGTGQLDFTYAEIVAILQGMADQQKLQVISPTGQQLAAGFLLQEDNNLRDAIDSAPSIERGRPQGQTESPKIDAPVVPADATEHSSARVGQATHPAGASDAAIAGRQ
jgi:hypothetical protein